MIVLAEAYLHRLDPFAIQFADGVGIRWYGLAYAAGFLAAWWLLRWFAATGRSPLTVRGAGDLMTLVIVGVLLGGRLGWAIFYQAGRPLVGFDGTFPYWDLLRIHEGGMSSHGGMLGVIAVCWWYAARHGIPRLHLMDLGALGCTPGLFLGRLANFVNGELWGTALPPAAQADPPPWSVKYPQELREPGVLPADVVDRLRELLPGDATLLPNAVEAIRAGNETVSEIVRPHLTAYWPSQIIQAITDGPLLAALLVAVWLKPRRPGVVGAWFLVGYGAMRIATETVRQPDPGVALLAGLSRGQVLSVLMVLAGIACLVICARRPVEPMSGLRPRAAR